MVDIRRGPAWTDEAKAHLEEAVKKQETVNMKVYEPPEEFKKYASSEGWSEENLNELNSLLMSINTQVIMICNRTAERTEKPIDADAIKDGIAELATIIAAAWAG